MVRNRHGRTERGAYKADSGSRCSGLLHTSWSQNNTFNNTAVIQPTVTGMNNYWTPAQNFSKSIVNGEITLDNAAEKTEDFYKLINTSIVK